MTRAHTFRLAHWLNQGQEGKSIMVQKDVRRGRRSVAIVLFALATIAVLVLGACGSKDSTSTTAASPSASKSASNGNTSGGGEAVSVKLSEYTIAPSMTSFKANTPYTFNVSNGGTMEHNFYIFKKGERVEGNAVAGIPTDKLKAGANASVNATFPAPGAYEIVCTVPGHEQLGMKLDITVA